MAFCPFLHSWPRSGGHKDDMYISFRIQELLLNKNGINWSCSFLRRLNVTKWLSWPKNKVKFTIERHFNSLYIKSMINNINTSCSQIYTKLTILVYVNKKILLSVDLVVWDEFYNNVHLKTNFWIKTTTSTVSELCHVGILMIANEEM